MKSISILLLTAYLFIGFSIYAPIPAQAQISIVRSCNLGYDAPYLAQIACPLVNLLNIATVGSGLILVVMLINVGIKYIMAQGDPKGLMAAQQAGTWAIIGFIVVIGAITLTGLLNTLAGSNKESVITNPFQSLIQAIDELLDWADVRKSPETTIDIIDKETEPGE